MYPQTCGAGGKMSLAEFMLYNGPGLRFLRQIDDFEKIWYNPVPGWRHMSFPFDPTADQQWLKDLPSNINPTGWINQQRHQLTMFGDSNATWGGQSSQFTTSDITPAMNVHQTRNSEFGGAMELAKDVGTATEDLGVHRILPVNKRAQTHPDPKVPGFREASQYIQEKPGETPNTLENFYGVTSNVMKDLITGAVVGNYSPPEGILIRAVDTINENNIKVKWSFYCKYTITIEAVENILGFWPCYKSGDQYPGWCGTNAFGFISRPGELEIDFNQPFAKLPPANYDQDNRRYKKVPAYSYPK